MLIGRPAVVGFETFGVTLAGYQMFKIFERGPEIKRAFGITYMSEEIGSIIFERIHQNVILISDVPIFTEIVNSVSDMVEFFVINYMYQAAVIDLAFIFNIFRCEMICIH